MNTIDHLTAELRLLYRARQQHLAGQHRHEPGAAQQWAELLHRYDMLLHRAANMLDIPAPPSLGARCYRSQQRAQLEARLAVAGLHVDTQPETAR